MADLLSLGDPLNAAEDIAVIQCYWKADFTDQAGSSRFKDYLKYYERQRAALTLGPKEFQIVQRVAAKTHGACERCCSLSIKESNVEIERGAHGSPEAFPTV